MTLCELLAKLDYTLRPLIINNAPQLGSQIYSCSRKVFLSMLASESFDTPNLTPEEYSKTLWGIKFRNSLFNAAGMYKYGEGYYTAYMQGAGAYFCGTATPNERAGNSKNGIKHPFISYPKSESASNWMGLPNLGFNVLARSVDKIKKREGCPIGVSISADPDDKTPNATLDVIEGLRLFQTTQADFIELNESCPNVPHQCDIDVDSGLDKLLIARLERISKEFISKKDRNLPIIVKFSNDTDVALVPKLLSLLTDLNFDGVNFGNTSTDYENIINNLKPRDVDAFRYFTETFGGGVSGAVIKGKSFNLSKAATEYLQGKELKSEFHLIRTGGIQNIDDLKSSEEIGVSLNQWYTGYFEAFASFGHQLYLEQFK